MHLPQLVGPHFKEMWETGVADEDEADVIKHILEKEEEYYIDGEQPPNAARKLLKLRIMLMKTNVAIVPERFNQLF